VQKTLAYFSRINKTVRGDIITLHDNKPNPVDNYTEIEFTITDKLNLSVTVYNLIGEPVKVIAKRRFPKGTHHVVWHADDEKGNLVPNGIYFYRLESKKGVAIKQLIVLR
jgi:flagellar hook assembly protein FlgD